MYRLIFVDIDKSPDDILMMQLGMLKERNKARVVGLSTAETTSTETFGNIFDEFLTCNEGASFTTIQKYCDDLNVPVSEVLVIGDYSLDSNTAGFKVQRPSDMAASYKKAMELLRGFKRE
ncbi:hypothetical protein SAMN02910275_01918 [Butyrivibrio sp. INlla18]|uniref:hypothetical protein n=1 Tax=Butyrivibrio sp. INlla18 TaxID=1520806 RepID=UPI00088B51B3|nr:hypothetical protein [Butyrivibrio sp. INlla18]SDA65918.1 hypothetical protein SAMN02910275_01918 [Butyrivibrio sp. INlla18]